MLACWRKRGAQVQAWPPTSTQRGKGMPDFGGSPRSNRLSVSNPLGVGGSHFFFRFRALTTAKLPQTVQNSTPFSSDKEWVSWHWTANG